MMTVEIEGKDDLMLTTEEGKARRRAGVAAMTIAEKIRRDLTAGRPPASELKTPQAAITSARTLHREIASRLKMAGLTPEPGDWGVSIGYITADLSAAGFTLLYSPDIEAALPAFLEGHIMLGLVFALVDHEAEDEASRTIAGIRPFIATKQIEGWLSELVFPVQLGLADPR